MRRDKGALHALAAVAGLAGLAALGSRGSMKRRNPSEGGPGGFDLDALLSIQQVEATPPECDIWLHNADDVNGFFVLDALRQAVGMSEQRATRVMMQAHRQGRAHVTKLTCPDGREKLAQVDAVAAEWDPAYARVFSLEERDG
jgi:ATP-dependent Clp protease adapter protein ClpS